MNLNSGEGSIGGGGEGSSGGGGGGEELQLPPQMLTTLGIRERVVLGVQKMAFGQTRHLRFLNYGEQCACIW